MQNGDENWCWWLTWWSFTYIEGNVHNYLGNLYMVHTTRHTKRYVKARTFKSASSPFWTLILVKENDRLWCPTFDKCTISRDQCLSRYKFQMSTWLNKSKSSMHTRFINKETIKHSPASKRLTLLNTMSYERMISL